jgi:hypothetical protein
MPESPCPLPTLPLIERLARESIRSWTLGVEILRLSNLALDVRCSAFGVLLKVLSTF